MNIQYDYQLSWNDYLRQAAYGCLLILIVLSVPSKIKSIQIKTLNDFVLVQTDKSNPSRIALAAIKENTKPQESLIQNQQIYSYFKLETPEPVSIQAQQRRGVGSVSFTPPAPRANYNDLLSSLNDKQKMRLANSGFTAGDYNELQKETQPTIIRGKKVHQGHLELNDGLALTDQHHIQIKYVVDGVTKSIGYFDPRTANYKIETDEDGGYIQADLVDDNGRVIGSGYYVQTTPTASGQKAFPVIPIKEYKAKKTSSQAKNNTTGSGVKARFKSHGANPETTDSQGILNDDSSTEGSNYITQAAAKGMATTTAFVKAGQNNNIIMLPNDYTEAFRGILSDNNIFIEGNNLYFARVTQDNLALIGVTVELEGESAEAAQVIYFNELYLPDFKLETTSSSGEFAIINLQQGMHTLLIKRGEQILGYRNFYINEENAVKENIQFSQYTHPATIYYYDALSGEPLDGMLALQSLKEQVEIIGGKNLQMLSDYNHIGFAFAEEDEVYAANYFQYDQMGREFYFPRIKKQWLQEARQYLKLSDDPHGKSLVGFVDATEDFEVFLQENTENKYSIVYFDKNGSLLSSSEGSAGGGFIVMGGEDDTVNISIIPKTSEKISSKFIIMDSGITSVLNFKF